MKFQSHFLECVTEWEAVVTTRVDPEWKHLRKLAADSGDYEKKVEALRHKANEMVTKGKSTKLQQAFEVDKVAAGKLCVLMEVATTLGG
jgi:hypothetical protein